VASSLKNSISASQLGQFTLKTSSGRQKRVSWPGHITLDMALSPFCFFENGEDAIDEFFSRDVSPSHLAVLDKND
jgi:hypothetical protein